MSADVKQRHVDFEHLLGEGRLSFDAAGALHLSVERYIDKATQLYVEPPAEMSIWREELTADLRSLSQKHGFREGSLPEQSLIPEAPEMLLVMQAPEVCDSSKREQFWTEAVEMLKGKGLDITDDDTLLDR